MKKKSLKAFATPTDPWVDPDIYKAWKIKTDKDLLKNHKKNLNIWQKQMKENLKRNQLTLW